MLLPFDELDNLIASWVLPFEKEPNREKVIDDIYEMLVYAYVYGWTNTSENLGIPLELKTESAERALYQPIAGKTWVERVNEAFDNAVEMPNGDLYAETDLSNGDADLPTDGGLYAPSGGNYEPLFDIIVRIVSTETTRVFSAGGEDAGEEAERRAGKNAVKTWRTMEDERVRITHQFLNGTTIPLKERFWTIDGDSAPYPGLFSLPQNSINCRCYVEVTWEK